MVDTIRTRSALETILADNTAGNISAQDIRDFLKSTTLKAEITAGNHIAVTTDGDNLVVSGYTGDSYVIVQRGLTDILSGTALRAAYTTAKALTPGGNALSSTNRAAVLIPPGTYDLVTTPLTLDTECVDLIGMTGDADGVFITSQVNTDNSGTIVQTVEDVHISNLTMHIDAPLQNPGNANNPAAYFPSSFPIVSGDTNSIIVNANEIYVEPQYRTGNNIYAKIIDNGAGASWHIDFYKEIGCTTSIGHSSNFSSNGKQVLNINGGSLLSGYIIVQNYDNIAGDIDIVIRVANRTLCKNVNFRTADVTKAWSMRVGIEYSGTFINCEGGIRSFGGEYQDLSEEGGDVSGTASGTFIDCVGGSYSFAGSYITVSVASGTFINCVGGDDSFGGGREGIASGTFIRCIGGYNSFGSITTGVASGIFSECAGAFNSFGFTASGIFTNCTGGGLSFGGNGGTASGTFINCIGGGGSFATVGTASGTFINCMGGDQSFGGNTGTASGTFINCRLATISGNATTLGVQFWGGTFTGLMEGCHWQVTDTDQSALVVDTGARIRNSTLIGTGAGYSITAGSSKTIEVVQCRMNKGMNNVTNSCVTPYNATIT